MEKDAKFYIITACLVLILVIFSVMALLAVKQAKLIEKQVHDDAGTLFDEIIIIRRWNSEHGGVYVKKKPGEVSNPYLKNPDITDVNGVVYTMKNPATMTRELSEYSEKTDRFRLHITSLNLRNPNNKPDEWERRSLLSFEKGKKEVAEVVEKGGRHFYRLMKPLYVEEACLGCHRDQGYKVGDVRGGISITLPYDEYYSAVRANFAGMAALAFLLVVILVSVLYFFVWRLLERLGKQKRELEELNETKDRLLGVAAHDLRNPLVIISGYTELLQGMTEDKAKLGLLEGIQSGTEKMLGLINNILDVSKIKRGRLELRPSEVDLAEFINSCIAANEFIGKKKNISLNASVPDGIGTATFDRERMRQAIDNLLSNAFKYSNPGSSVTLGAGKSEGSLRIWVADQGVGIKDEEVGRVFEEFFKASARPTGGETSHGLGLAIAKKVVELHEGRILVESKTGQGSTFTITLPLVQP